MTSDFEQHREHLRGVAFRMLGSLAEADDAVQEAWLRMNRAEPTDVQNERGWLTTVVARICLDMLRARKSRREEPMPAHVPDTMIGATHDPKQEAELADSVGLALLVVLDVLAPAERLAFVLHDLFGLSFDEIATIVGRSPAAARQLASRARRRVRGAPAIDDSELVAQRSVVDAFVTAIRAGDFEGLIAVLDPEVVVRSGTTENRMAAQDWAKNALQFAKAAQFVRAALVGGLPGVIFAPRGKLTRALRFTIEHGKIVAAEVLADPSQIDVGVLAESD